MPQPFTYTGYQKDSIAGTYYAQVREYLPQVGRFISEDIVKGFKNIGE
ncbi:RHS repeat-associated core domain-containing protein [Aequitasia blattaphilus]